MTARMATTLSTEPTTQRRGLTPFLSDSQDEGQTPLLSASKDEGQTLVLEEVLSAIRSVDDPEYPGVSIVDLGLLESLDIDGSTVRVGLIPTFSGCPALAMIRGDVALAVSEVDGIDGVEVEWLKAPVWTVDRITAETRAIIQKEFTVAVRIGSESPACPLCGGPTTEQSLFGPSRCRSVNRCAACSETVEVMRS